jgi:hypothetical protein
MYDPTDKSPSGWATAMGNIIGSIYDSIIPSYIPSGLYGAVTGDTSDRGADFLRATLPAAGITVSRGAPGGPEVGEFYEARRQAEFRWHQELPDILKGLKSDNPDDVDKANQRMLDLGIPAALRRYYRRVAVNPRLRLSPRAVREFNKFATPEEQEKMDRARNMAPQ